MNAYTPGPWFVADSAMFADRMPRIATKGPSVAQICLTGNATQDANARLIAAAPDLYEALRDLMLVVDALMPAIKHLALQDYKLINDAPLAAKAALAKAVPDG